MTKAGYTAVKWTCIHKAVSLNHSCYDSSCAFPQFCHSNSQDSPLNAL